MVKLTPQQRLQSHVMQIYHQFDSGRDRVMPHVLNSINNDWTDDRCNASVRHINRPQIAERGGENNG